MLCYCSLFQGFLPFFTLLGAYLPLLDPTTPIPAPCIDPLKKKSKGRPTENQKRFFFCKFQLFWCFFVYFSVFCHFSHFWDPICPWKTPLPPFLLLLCSPWRNKELEETDLKPKIVSFSINYTCFAVFLYFYVFLPFFKFLWPFFYPSPLYAPSEETRSSWRPTQGKK